MFTLTPSAYLGKEDFYIFLQSLPSQEKEIPASQKIELSLNAFKLYSKGLPYNLRPECLYYFYHYYPTTQNDIEADILESLETLNNYAALSLTDMQIMNYLGLLEPEKFFEVFQVRGVIEGRISGLEDYLNLLPEKEWGEIQQRILSFLDREPVCSHQLIEKMLTGLSNFYYDNHLKTSVRYRIAEKIWDCSTHLDMLHSAWLCLNNPEDIFEYKKATLPEAEVVKLLRLEKLEKEIMNAFDESKLDNKGRKLLKKLFADDFCLTWLRLIDDNIDLLKNDGYVKGYAEFLRGYVCLASGHLKRALRELERAYLHKYNPVIVLMYIVNILETLGKNDEAVEYALQTVKLLGADYEDINKEECLQKVAKVLRLTNKEPVLINSIIDNKARENTEKMKQIISSVYPRKIEDNRKNNIIERIKHGISLFDGLIDAELINLFYNSPPRLDETFITIPLSAAEELGLDEISFFDNDIEPGDGCINTELSISTLIEYNSGLIIKYSSQINSSVEDIIKTFPNSLACIFVCIQVVNNMTGMHRETDACKIIDYFISCQKEGKINGLFELVEPVRIMLESNGKFREETALISKIILRMNDGDLEKANGCLAEVKKKTIHSNEVLNQQIKHIIHSIFSSTKVFKGGKV